MLPKARYTYLLVALFHLLSELDESWAFAPASAFGGIQQRCQTHRSQRQLFMADEKKGEQEEGVLELADEDGDVKKPSEKVVAPFLSQGEELAEGVLNPDLSDPKQTRVILYIIISLIPVLFLIPLMIGSRDLIPLDALPPVDMTN